MWSPAVQIWTPLSTSDSTWQNTSGVSIINQGNTYFMQSRWTSLPHQAHGRVCFIICYSGMGDTVLSYQWTKLFRTNMLPPSSGFKLRGRPHFPAKSWYPPINQQISTSSVTAGSNWTTFSLFAADQTWCQKQLIQSDQHAVYCCVDKTNSTWCVEDSNRTSNNTFSSEGLEPKSFMRFTVVSAVKMEVERSFETPVLTHKTFRCIFPNSLC